MSLDAYLRYLNSRDDAAKPLPFEEQPHDNVRIGWIVASIVAAYFATPLIERFL